MKIFSSFLSFLLLLTLPGAACDLCGCYLPTPSADPARHYSLYAGVSEQFTHFGTLQFNDREVGNPAGQYLDSSVSQIVLGVSFLDHRLALQVNVPIIYRSFKRPEGFATDRGEESGPGDLSFLANAVIFRHEAKEPGGFSTILNLIGGVKFPTGDSSRIREEFHEAEVEGAPESGIHGHDLTLGTGSYDAIIGVQTLLEGGSFFWQAEAQFTLRGDGLHSYHFANDLSWSGGPGLRFFRKEGHSFNLQAVLSGESKDTDRFQGRIADDTGVTALYVGPRLTAEFPRWTADLGVDLPVVMNTTKFQAVPDYRIHAGLSVHF